MELKIACDRFSPNGERMLKFVPKASTEPILHNDIEEYVLSQNDSAAELNFSKDCFRLSSNTFGVHRTKRQKNLDKKQWTIHDKDGVEEELFYENNVFIQSFHNLHSPKSSIPNRIFTLKEDIIELFPCHFVIEEKEFAEYEFEILANSLDGEEDFMNLFNSGFTKDIRLKYKMHKNTDNCMRILRRTRTLCAFDKHSIHVFSDDGDSWQTQLDFQIKSVASTDYGLIFERSLMKSERIKDSKFALFPTIFTLSKFQGELCPVWKVVPKDFLTANHYFTRMDSMNLVDFLIEDDIAVFYSTILKVHMFFHFRPIKSVEVELIQGILKRKMSTQVSHPPTEVDPEDPTDIDLLLNTTPPPNTEESTNVSLSSSLHHSLTERSQLTFNHSINHSMSLNMDSPKNSTMMTRSKSQKVRNNIFDMDTFNFSSESSIHRSHLLSTSQLSDFRMNNSIEINEMSLSLKNLSFQSPNKILGKDGDTEEEIEAFGIVPEYTLVYLYSEESPCDSMTSKCFSSTDLFGQTYLCLLQRDYLEGNYLKLINFTRTSEQITILSTTKIKAKNAEPMKNMKMIIVIDIDNRVHLYSGVHKICDVSLFPSPTPVIPSEPKRTDIHHKVNASLESSKVSIRRNQEDRSFVFKTPKILPRRAKEIKSLTSTPSGSASKNGSQLFFSPNASVLQTPSIIKMNSTPLSSGAAHTSKQLLFSPSLMKTPLSNSSFLFNSPDIRSSHKSDLRNVLPLSFPLVFVGFSDSVDRRVTVKTMENDYLRVTFPKLFDHPVVGQCLGALLQTLDLNIATQVISSWYAFRSVHFEDNQSSELYLFKLCILQLVGYSLDSVFPSEQHSNKLVIKKPFYPSLSVNNNGISRKKLPNKQFNRIFSSIPITNEELDTYCATKDTEQLNDSLHAKKIHVMDFARLKLAFSVPSTLFADLPTVLYCFHLIYEELKLSESAWNECKSLVSLLFILASDLKLESYQEFYQSQYPSECSPHWSTEQRVPQNVQFKYPEYFTESPFSVFKALQELIDSKMGSFSHSTPIPFLGCDTFVKESTLAKSMELITPNIFKMSFLFANLSTHRFVRFSEVLKCIGHSRPLNQGYVLRLNGYLVQEIKRFCSRLEATYQNIHSSLCSPEKWNEKILHFMVLLRITAEDIADIPVGLRLPLLNVLWTAKVSPKSHWSAAIYLLIDRLDLVMQDCESHGYKYLNESINFSDFTFKNNFVNSKHKELNCFDQETIHLMFPDDQRVQDAFDLLVSNKPVIIQCKQAHGVSDTDFLEQQEKVLVHITPRTQAKSAGRGMLTLSTYAPVWHETFQIPPLCLTGQSASHKTPIELSNFDAPSNYWPVFHNGCAAGLRVRNEKIVDGSWIQYNKPKVNASPEEIISHAGFLFAMGLNKLLPNLSRIHFYDYLSNNNEFTNSAIMLGLSAAKRGTADQMVFKILALRLECFLPSTSTDLEISPMCRTSACMGVGLLFQKTRIPFIIEVLLNEIGRPPGPEMENYMDRESHSLTAGVALGMVTLGQGSALDPYISPDGNTIPVQLNHYMFGAPKKSSCLSREQQRPASFHVQEGENINLNVTSPGATLALGLMYFNTKHKIISSWMKVPDTQVLLEHVRPDFLFLRMVAHSLINWSEIVPTKEWMMSHMPKLLLDFAQNKLTSDVDQSLDRKLLGQAYCNIIGGTSFALALKFAGSGDERAYSLIHDALLIFIDAITSRNLVPFLSFTGKNTLYNTLCGLLISCSMIMSGFGDIELLKLCRFYRFRTDRHMTYGGYMALHMAIGLNFLGGCKLTLNNSPQNLPVLIMAFYPKFPFTTNDNRYHLQLFRHLYVLAVEPRLIIPKSVDLKEKVYAYIRFTFKDPAHEPVVRRAPCQVPQLDQLKSIELVDEFFWDVCYSTPKQLKRIHQILKYSGVIYVKQRLQAVVYNERQLFSSTSNICDRYKNFYIVRSHNLFNHTNDELLRDFFLKFLLNKPQFGSDEIVNNRKSFRLISGFLNDETFAAMLPILEFLCAHDALIKNAEKSDVTQSDRYCLVAATRYDQHLVQLYSQIGFVVALFNRYSPKSAKLKAIKAALGSRMY